MTYCWEGKHEPGIHVLEKKFTALSNQGRNVELAGHLKKIKSTGQYDCVIGFTKMPGLDIYYAGDPCYAENLSRKRLALIRLLPRYKRYLDYEKQVFVRGKHTRLLLIAHQQMDLFVKHYRTEKERFYLLPPGINRERIMQEIPTEDDVQALKTELGISDGEKILLNVGSGFRTKGIDRIIKAVSALPEKLRKKTKLLIVGDDKAKPFRQFARSLKIEKQVIFTGGRKDVVHFYHIADALIHPAYSENTGTTLIEAMLCGLPVLATENCGFSYHIKRAQAGLIEPVPFQQSHFNKQLVAILNEDKKEQWADNGIHYCRKTDLYSLIEKASDIIEETARIKQQNKA